MDATDERQYMLTEDYEIYEKIGAPVGATSLHYHDFYEILYISEGEFDIYVEPSVYHLNQGDFLLIDRNRIHHYLYQPVKHQSSSRILLWVSGALLAELGQGQLDLTRCFSSSACAWHFPALSEHELCDFLQKLVAESTRDTESQLLRGLTDRSYLTLFFTTLYQLQEHGNYLSLQDESSPYPLVRAVSHYIDQHLAEDLSLDTLASQIHMSKYHFLRSFKSMTGLTVHQFILQKRLIAACEHMRKGAAPNVAAPLCGFSDYSSFYRNFKRAYGISPKEYCSSHDY